MAENTTNPSNPNGYVIVTAHGHVIHRSFARNRHDAWQQAGAEDSAAVAQFKSEGNRCVPATISLKQPGE